jgi:prepilin-type N-terminal cleavage/methylation domain-containing protein
MQKTRSGFTIVELLIVIVVIAVLATISTVAYSGIQQRARDSIRQNDIKVLAEAIEMFYAVNGNYPMTSGWCTQPSGAAYATAFQNEIAPFLPEFPRDPSFSGTYQDYFYRNIGDTSYYLYAEMEGSDLADDGFTGCTRTGGLNNEYDYRYPSF